MNHTDQAKKQITETIQTYVTAYLSADGKLLTQAFNHETRLYTVQEDQLQKLELSDWVLNLAERKAKGDIRQAALQVESIDVTANSAVAKIKLTFAKAIFTDYLSLLRFGDSWMIVGKIYTSVTLDNPLASETNVG